MMRSGLILCATLAIAALACPDLAPVPPKLIWNASASVPIGLYANNPAGPFQVGDLVVVRTTEPLATFLAERGYLPGGVPLLKRIIAVSGQTVCRSGLLITVDGTAVGKALERDRANRDLPAWRGCRHISASEVFLMNRQVRDSLDGRYFGPTATAQIIGRALPLWTDEDGNGRFQWRASTR